MSSLVRPASLPRRLAAAVYDSLLITALWFLIGFAALPFSSGEAVPVAHPLFAAILYGVTAGFFVYFWLNGGQTLGMRAWRLQLRAADGEKLRLGQALWRLLLAIPSWLCAGLGVLYLLFDPQRQSLHDRLSGTEMVLIPRPGPTAS